MPRRPRLRLRPPALLPFWIIDGCVRCPAVPIVLAMGIAIPVARFWLPALPRTFLAIAATSVALGVVLRHRAWPATLLLIVATFCATLAATDVAIHRYPADHVTHYATEEGRLARLRMHLPNEPRLRTVSFGNRLPFPPKQTTLAEVTEILTRDGWRRASGTVLLQVRQPKAALAAGQTIEALARLERPGIAMNPGQFDWQRYYREHAVLCSVQVRRADNLTILRRDAPPVLTRCREAVRRLLARGFAAGASLDHALLAALVLGDYDPELRDVKDQFRQTGTSHHLAISGMHIAIVGGLAFLMLRLVGVGPRGCWAGGLAVVGCYACVAMPSPPVMRSVILFGVAGFAFLSTRFSSAIQLLAVTVAVMLAVHPLDLFNAGFQLSFGTVLGLMLLSEPLAARLAGEGHVVLPGEIERLPPGARALRWVDRHGIRTLATGLIAWLVSMPLVATHFTQLNPWQVPASLALAPVVVASLLLGVAKIVGTLVIPSLAVPLATVAAGSSATMRAIVEWLARWPYGDVPLTAPPAWLAALCWVALALAIVRWRLASVRVGSIALVVGAFAYMLAGPYWFGSSATLAAGQVRVTLMAVGAGQACLVEAGDRAVMIDCGSDSLTDLTSNVVVPLMRAYGRTRLDSIYVSHANADHYSGVAEVAAIYGAREIVVGGSFVRSAGEASGGASALRQLAAIDLAPRVARRDDRVPLTGDAALDVLWPADDDPALSANDGSLVLRLAAAGRTVLFTGDVQSAGLRGLLERPGTLRADVLVAPHHGSSEDESAAFVDAVAPAWIVSSNDRTLSGKQKRFDTLTNGRPVLRTHEYGAITLTIDRDGTLRVEGFVKDVE